MKVSETLHSTCPFSLGLFISDWQKAHYTCLLGSLTGENLPFEAQAPTRLGAASHFAL